MTTNQNPKSKMEQARELLSPYIDGEVTTDERALVEAMMVQSPGLAAELDELQQTMKLVRELPRMAAARPFTLTEADVGIAPESERKAPFFQTWLKPLMGAAAALAAVAIVGAMFFSVNSPRSQEAASIARAPLENLAQEAAPADSVAEEAAVVLEKEIAAEAADVVEAESAAEMEAAPSEALTDVAEAGTAEADVAGAAADEAFAESEDMQVQATQPLPAAAAPPAAAEKSAAGESALGLDASRSATTEVAAEEVEAPTVEGVIDGDATGEFEAPSVAATVISATSQSQKETSPQVQASPTPDAEPTATVAAPPPSVSAEDLEAMQAEANKIFFVWVCAPATVLVVIGFLIVVFVFTRKPKSEKEASAQDEE